LHADGFAQILNFRELSEMYFSTTSRTINNTFISNGAIKYHKHRMDIMEAKKHSISNLSLIFCLLLSGLPMVQGEERSDNYAIEKLVIGTTNQVEDINVNVRLPPGLMICASVLGFVMISMEPERSQKALEL